MTGETPDLQQQVWALEAALLQVMGNRHALVVALRAIIQTNPQAQEAMKDLLAAVDPAKFPDTWPKPFQEGFQGTAAELLQDAVTAGVQQQAQGQTKN